MAQVLPATSRDDTLPMLTAVCLDIRGGVMTLAATDRYRLAVRDLTWQPASPQVRAIALVPARTLADAARVMAPGVPVSVAFGPPGDEGAPGRGGDPRPVEGMISFESGGQRLTGRLIAGEFIKYESRFPAGYGCRAELPAASLIEAVRRVSLVADRASPVRLTFESGHGRPGGADRGPGPGGRTGYRELPRRRAGDRLQPALPARRAHRGGGRVRARPEPCRTGGGPDGDRQRGGATARRHRHCAATAAAATVRLEFTSPAKPALITLAGGAAGAPGTNDGAGETGDVADRANDVAGAPASGGATPRPGFRYLVVPLRSPARA